MIKQIQGLVAAMPDYIAGLVEFLGRRYPDIFGEQSQIMRNLTDVETMMREGGLTVMNQVLAGSLKVLDFLILLVVTPVVTFYLLLDWDKMVDEINRVLPRQHAPTIRRLAREIDLVLAGFVRGQLSVCLVLGVFYAVALTAIGLQFGFLVGHRRGADLVRSLRRLGGGALALGGDRHLPVLGRPVLDPGDGGDLLLRPVRRGQHPVAEPDRQVGGAASGLADPRPVGLRHALRLRGPSRRRAGGGGASACSWRFLVERYRESALYTGREPPADG